MIRNSQAIPNPIDVGPVVAFDSRRGREPTDLRFRLLQSGHVMLLPSSNGSSVVRNFPNTTWVRSGALLALLQARSHGRAAVGVYVSAKSGESAHFRS